MRKRARVGLIGVGMVATALTIALPISLGTQTEELVPVALPTSGPFVSAVTPRIDEAPSPESNPPEVSDAVAAAVEDASSGTDLGFLVYDRQTGKTLASINPEKPFYTASVVKLLIALDVLHRDDWHTPDVGTAESLTNMLAGSNDSIASSLWGAYGGTTIVNRMVDLIGLQHTTPPSNSGKWELTKMSATDILAVYQYLHDIVPDEVAQPIINALSGARNPADDGFNQYFGIPEGLPGSFWEIKQGWMVLNSSLVLNSTGIVDSRYVVVLLTEQPAGTSSAKGRAAVTAGIAAAAPVLGQTLNG